MLRLLIDQDLDHVILRGLLLRVPNLDVITAHQVGLSNASDPDLSWRGRWSKSGLSLRTIDALCPITQPVVLRERRRLLESSLFPGNCPSAK
jgi:hypothetical protein